MAQPAPDYRAMLQVAIKQARQGLAEGGILTGAALVARNGQQISSIYQKSAALNWYFFLAKINE